MWAIVQKTAQDISAAIYATLNTWSTNLYTWLNTTAERIQSRWHAFWANVSETVSTITKNILTALSTWKTDLDTRFNTFISQTKTNWDNFWRDIHTRFTTWVSDTLRGIDTMKTDFLTKIGTFFTDLTERWGRGLQVLVDKVVEIKDNIISALTSQDVLDDFFNGMFEIGANIVAGIVDGINKNIQKAVDAMKKLAGVTQSETEDDTETHSPSEVYKRIGSYWVDGLALGIKEQAYKVTRAMGNITMGSITTAGSLTPVSASAGITNYNFTIDARGSTMTEKQFRDIAREEMNKAAQTAGRRVR
jgi:hypothetical protein